MNGRIEDHDPIDNGLRECLQVFKPSITNVIAGFILSAVAGAGGLAFGVAGFRMASSANFNLPMYVEDGPCWFMVGFFVLIGIGIVGLGIFLIAFSRQLMARRVELYEKGFRYISQSGIEEVYWNDVTGIKETILYERPPILKGPAKLLIPKITSTSYTVATVAGKQYEFDGNSVTKIKEFGSILRKKAEQQSLPWDIVEEHA